MDKRAHELQCYSRVSLRTRSDTVLGVKHHRRYRVTSDEARPKRSAWSTSLSKCSWPLFLSLVTLQEWLSHTIREATVVEGYALLVLVRCKRPIDWHRPGFCYVACTRWCCIRLSRRANVLPHSHTKAARKQNRTKTQHVTPYQFVVQCKKGERGTRRSPGGKVGLYVRFSYVCNDITCRLRCSARAKLLEQPGTAQMCVRSRASSGSGTLRPRLFLIRCGTGAGGGTRLRGPVRWVFRCSGEGLRSTTGLAPAVGGGESFSSNFATPTAFPVAAAATDVSLQSLCSPSNCAYIRRNRAGTRIGLLGLEGPKAKGEEGGSIGDVEGSVGSADEVREDG